VRVGEARVRGDGPFEVAARDLELRDVARRVAREEVAQVRLGLGDDLRVVRRGDGPLVARGGFRDVRDAVVREVAVGVAEVDERLRQRRRDRERLFELGDGARVLAADLRRHGGVVDGVGVDLFRRDAPLHALLRRDDAHDLVVGDGGRRGEQEDEAHGLSVLAETATGLPSSSWDATLGNLWLKLVCASRWLCFEVLDRVSLAARRSSCCCRLHPSHQCAP